MIYGFDTEDVAEATAALLVYAVWRSRDKRRFKITPDVWGQIERFVKSAAKRAYSLPDFLERLKPRLACDTLHPAALRVGADGTLPLLSVGDGSYIDVPPPEDRREFLTGVLAAVDQRTVLQVLYRETSWTVLLVRDRLEREKPLESRFDTALNIIGGEA